MRFITSLEWIKMDLTAYRRGLIDHLTKINKEAGQLWLHTALQPIPTWSGASRATFVKLARELGTSVPFGRISAKDRTALGMLNSTGSGVITDPTIPYVGFMYKSSLRYLTYNEFNAATPGPPPQPFGKLRNPTPYHFTTKALAAWEAFAKTAKLPNPYSRKYTNLFKV